MKNENKIEDGKEKQVLEHQINQERETEAETQSKIRGIQNLRDSGSFPRGEARVCGLTRKKANTGIRTAFHISRLLE